MSTQAAIAPGDRVVPWINQCPPEWSLKPLKYAAKINSRTLAENTASDLEVTYIDISSVDSDGRQNTAETMTFGDAPSRARRIVARGDVIISTVRPYLKAISYIESANHNLICSTGFAVITPGSQVHPKFLFYWVRSEWFINEIVARSVGVSYPAINAIEIGSLPFPAIPLEKQQAIADFLDHEIARIDEMIAQRKRLIELLQEQRPALITCTVTRGLNPDAPMKDSGVEWLGEIPAHWGVKRLKYIIRRRVTDGPHLTPEFVDEGIPFLSVDSIQDGELDFDDCRYVAISDHNTFRAKASPEKGDILLGKAASTGKIAQVKVDFEFSIWSPLALIKPDKYIISSTYLEFSLKSTFLQSQIDVLCTHNTQNNISMDDIPILILPFPPIGDQKAIADYLDRETTRIGNLIGRVNQVIEKLQEYRSAVITAAVTSKIDFREEIVRYE